MNIKDFEYIVEIARQGNISRAATRLYITQPALSRFLQRIEEEIGTALFYKSGKQFVPTEAGKCYLDYAYKILQLNIDLEESLNRIIANSQDIIRIGASASRGEFLASLVLPLIKSRYPDYKTTLVLNTKKVLMPMLENNDLDIIFVNTAAEHPGYRYHHIASEDMVLLVHKDHFLVKQACYKEGYKYPYVKAELWKDCPFIYPASNMNTGRFIRSYMGHMNIHPFVVSEISNIELIFSAVKSKMGISIVPSLPHKSIASGELHYLALEAYENNIWNFSAVTKDNTPLNLGLTRLIEVAQELYPTL